MFRPNRIGTPVIHQLNAGTIDTSNTAPNAFTYTAQVIQGHQINAAALLDFGVSTLNWTPAAAQTLNNGTAVAYGQIVTLTPPISGDTVGVELIGAMRGVLDVSMAIIPFCSALGSIGATVLANMGATVPYAQIGEALQPLPTAAVQHRIHNYKESVIINPVTGGFVFAHGFIISNASGANRTITGLNFDIGVRQLNDQQNIGYRDTRR